MKSSKILCVAVCVVGLGLTFVNKAEAGPILGFGGNSYEYVQILNPLTGPAFQSFPQNSWQAASSAAAASTFMGVAGHLATITSQQENNFVASLVINNPAVFSGAWLGGRAVGGNGVWLEGPEGVAPDPFSYVNWRAAEPNNDGFVYMSIADDANLGKWLDDSVVPIAGDDHGIPTFPNDPVIGYFIEFEGVTPAPAPPALPIFLGGVFLLGLLRRRT